ncbi:MAG: HEAT repeat domain-containing protein [Acidimicrobiales bacterium]
MMAKEYLDRLSPTERAWAEKALRFHSFEDRFEAIEALQQLLNPHAWQQLRDVLIREEQDEDSLTLGVDMLGLDATQDSLLVPLLVNLARRWTSEGSSELKWSIAHALAGLKDPSVLDPLVALSSDSDGDVRWQAAFGLPKALTPTHTEALGALLRLSEDEDADIRDWATFGLGSQIKFDGPEIRNALVERINDESEDVAEEALLGLARRGDERSREPILNRLPGHVPGTLVVEAAGILGDPLFLPLLQRLEEASWADERGVLSQALLRCRPGGGSISDAE